MTTKQAALAFTVQYGVSSATLPAPAALKRWAKAAAGRAAMVTVRFVGRREGQTLNAHFRGKEYATNVLAFVYDGSARIEGDIVLCAPVVRDEARREGKALADHCAHLVVHGMLHLQGYDHDTVRAARAMEKRETAILATLGVPDPYAVATRGGRPPRSLRSLPPEGAHSALGAARRALR